MADQNPMGDAEKKAFDFVCDITKQLLTLSTAIIVAVITLFDKTGEQALLHSLPFRVILCLYLASIVCGIVTIMSMAGSLARTANPSIYAGNVRVFGGLQFLLFLGATACMILMVA